MFTQTIERIYPSYLALYVYCPRLYELVRIERRRRKRTKKAVFGEIVHGHIAEYYSRMREEGKIGEEEIRKKIGELRERGGKMFEKEEGRKYRKIMKNFEKGEIVRIRKEGKENYLPVFIEKEFRVRMEEETIPERVTELAVRIDAGWKNGVIVDWKTGERERYSVIQSGMIQIIMEKEMKEYKKIEFNFLLRGEKKEGKEEEKEYAKREIKRFVKERRERKYRKRRNKLRTVEERKFFLKEYFEERVYRGEKKREGNDGDVR